MLRILLCLVLFIFVACSHQLPFAGEPVRLRINTTHALDNARGAVRDAGLSLTSQVLVSPSSNQNGRPYLSPKAMLYDGLLHGATIVSSSFSGWNYLYDTACYPGLVGKGVTHVYAYVPRTPQPPQAPPPATFVTVNRIGGVSGGGIEFGVTDDYMKGKGDGRSPSGVTAQLAGLMACLKYRHPDWNWFDVKAALRATASNFETGYDMHTYGYGTIDYRAADSIGRLEQLPLFSPATVVIAQKGNLIVFRINAFRQSRRFTDVLFRFTSRPTTTRKEMTLNNIMEIGGSLVCSSYLARDDSSYIYNLSPGENPYFVWFTRDLAGNYSRIEPYSILGPFSSVMPPPQRKTGTSLIL